MVERDLDSKDTVELDVEAMFAWRVGSLAKEKQEGFTWWVGTALWMLAELFQSHPGLAAPGLEILTSRLQILRMVRVPHLYRQATVAITVVQF